MSTGLQGQKILYTTLFMGKVCRKNPGFDKDKTDVMFGLSLYDCIFHFSLCTSKGIKVPFENKVMGLTHRSLVSPCCSFFPFPSFSPFSLFFSLCSSFRMTPWNTRALLAFYVNQGRSSLFLFLFFFFFLNFLIADAVILRVPLDPAGAGPWQGSMCADLAWMEVG